MAKRFKRPFVDVVLSDFQGHYVDRRALRSVLAFLEGNWVDRVVLNGDIVDFTDIGAYRKHPNQRKRLDDEARFVRETILAPIRAVVGPRTPIVYLEGNHEDRLYRYLADRAPELYQSMLGVGDLLQLPKFGISYRGKDYLRINQNMVAIHGHVTRKWSGHTARAVVTEYKCSVVLGHCHRLGTYYESGLDGREWVGIENGHLMDTRRATYVAGVPNWQQGGTVIWSWPSGNFTFSQFKIIRGKLYFNGEVFEG